MKAAVLVALGALLAVGAFANRAMNSGDGVRVVRVGIEHSAFRLEPVTVQRGQSVKFVVQNTDPIAHEFLIGDDAAHRRHEVGTEPTHGSIPGEISVGPNETASTTYRFDTPGLVRYACHLRGHVGYGMEGTVLVVD